MSTSKKPGTSAKTGANSKGANAKSGANSKGANAKKAGANSKGANAKAPKANGGALKPSEMAKAIGLTRVGFNQWKNGKNEVVARTDSDQGILVPTRKGTELGFDPMAEFKKSKATA